MAGTHTTSRPAGFADETTSTEGSSKVGDFASRAQDAAGAAAGTIKEHGSELQKTAKDKLATKADDGRTKAVEKVRDVESDLRELTSSVRDKQPQVADMLDSVIDRADSLVTYVENTSISHIAEDLRRQARQRPWAVIGGMFAAGFVLARALKPVDGVIEAGTHGHLGGQRSEVVGVGDTMPRSSGDPLRV